MKEFFVVLQLFARFPLLQRIRIIFYFFDSFVLMFMRKPLKQQDKKKVIIFFTHSLGDCAMFCSMFESINQIFPPEEFELIYSCKSFYAELFYRSDRNVLPIDYIKTSVNPFYRIAFLKKMRESYYDIAIDPAGADECFPSVYGMNAVCAGQKIGALCQQKKKYQCPAWLRNKIFSKIIFIEKENLHKNLFFARFFSELSGRNVIPCVQKIIPENMLPLPPHYYVIFPSASITAKKWPVERFAAIARKLYDLYPLPVLCIGTEQDAKSVRSFISLLGKNIMVFNFLKRTNIMQTVDILARADLVLTNDTSIYHLAVGAGSKVCVVSGAYTYSTFLDYTSQGYGDDVEKRIRICAHKSLCMDCNNDCRFHFTAAYPCVEKTTVNEVFTACCDLLGKEFGANTGHVPLKMLDARAIEEQRKPAKGGL